MNRRKGRKKYVCGAGILLISLIVFYTVLNSMENKRTLQVKNEIYTFEMTEEEAAKAVFDYIYSDCDYDYDAKVISTMQQGQMVYLYQTQEKSDLQYEVLQSKDRTEDGQYYVFAHDTRYETDALSQGFYYEYHTDYAVNRKTGEVLQESQWIETDAGYKLLYSEAYEKAVNQLYFNEDVSDGNMPEEQAARVLFYYMYSDEGGDYDSIVVRTYKQEQSVYVYQFPEDQEFPCVRNFSCKGMTEDKEYYLFADYTDYYTHGYEPGFTHYQYLTNYAVNRETGEVLREREWSDIECEWLYNEEYKKAVK